MEVMYANLHMHSGYSDAGFTPEQLVRIGKAVGHKALALTDHETDAGCQEFMENCRLEGIECVTGAEFYGKFNGRAMHITALDFDSNAPSIRNFIDERCHLQARWAKAGFDKAKRLGLLDEVTWEEVVVSAGKGAWLCYDSVLNLLSQKHVSFVDRRPQLVEIFRRDEEVRVMKPAYPEAADVFRAVRDAGGVVGVAHPSEVQFDFIEQLIDYGMNAIEVSYSCRTVERERGKELALELAARRNLYKMGGTDHSGPLSANGGILAVPIFNGISEEDFRILKDRKLG